MSAVRRHVKAGLDAGQGKARSYCIGYLHEERMQPGDGEIRLGWRDQP